MYIAAYLGALTVLAGRGKGSRDASERQVAFFKSLPPEATARLDRGEYPPYHLINAARRAAGVPTETAKNWLQAFLYWRSRSLRLGPLRGAKREADPGYTAGSGLGNDS
jgi:hypothetical protein